MSRTIPVFFQVTLSDVLDRTTWGVLSGLHHGDRKGKEESAHQPTTERRNKRNGEKPAVSGHHKTLEDYTPARLLSRVCFIVFKAC